MQDILLLEPGYKNKYPPLGLMKIAFYHRKHRGDFVKFQKGKVESNLLTKKWDRIYISTLFTFEWEKTIETIKHAQRVAKNPEEIFIGGVLATLMPEEIKKETGIKPICGLLNKKGLLGYDDEDIIDQLPPDYSILSHVENFYQYPYEDAYFAYTTRGCGMKCDFCAVHILEPEYQEFVPIKGQIEKINEEFGEKKDLLLMDNNVLKSAKFDRIIEEIKEAGFFKGATFFNPDTGKKRFRYVDFNQGLDANFLSEKKAKKLGELALKPARIAFDHIEDQEVYIKAMERCVKNGINNLSNYILFNTKSFKGKGKKYKADTPEDLYKRLRVTMELKEKFNKEFYNDEDKVKIYSFPMKYVPFKKNREFIGDYWNEKYLRAIQVMLIPTQGKGVSGKSFFEADFGENEGEFKKTLLMPEKLIACRGKLKRKTNETTQDWKKRTLQREKENKLTFEWERLYEGIENKELFLKRVKDNHFTPEKFFRIEEEFKRIYIFYLTNVKFFSLAELLSAGEGNNKDRNLVIEYILKEFPLFSDLQVDYLLGTRVAPKKCIGFFMLLKNKGLKKLLEKWCAERFISEDSFLDRLNFWVENVEGLAFDIDLLRLVSYFEELNCFKSSDYGSLKEIIVSLDNEKLRVFLKNRFEDFKTALFSKVEDKYAVESIERQFNLIVNQIDRQLSLFD